MVKVMKYLFAGIISLIINSSLYSGNILIGTSTYDPPFVMATGNSGSLFGFEIDLMNEVCKRTHNTCQYKPFTFEKLLAEVSAGKVDIAVASITITEERQLSWIFSMPYLVSKAGLLTKTPNNINNFNDVHEKKIGMVAGTVFKAFSQTRFPDAIIREYTTQPALFQAMGNNDVDLIILDYVTAQYWINNNDHLFKLIGSPMNLGTGYGVMTAPDKSALISQINKALDDMQNDGTYLSIYQRYF